MKKHSLAFVIGFLVLNFVSCNPMSRGSGGIIQPGDMIGEMIVEQSTEVPFQNIRDFCEIRDEYGPVSISSTCNIPPLSSLDIPLGWFAKESKLDENWDVIVWEMDLDGNKIDLDAFKLFEYDYSVKGENNKERTWIITLRNLTPGKHTLRQSLTMETEVDDGWNVYQPGTYEWIVDFTVQVGKEYPTLSKNIVYGQHPFTSDKAQLDFLLYLPNEFGEDPAKEWPLIIYLHGAPFRDSTLELLEQESLPRYLKMGEDIPFIVISPLGYGDHEFWADDGLIDSLFTLIEEIQSVYPVDSKRIYLTGNDMGANGVWVIGLQNPDYFAALAPISGYYGWPPEVPENICDLKNVPVWAFHGERDDIISIQAGQILVDALENCGGNVELTVSQDLQIELRYKVYQDPELYDWFLSNSLQ